MPVEMQEMFLMETAVACWSDTHNADVGHVVDKLGEVCPLWWSIVNGQWFQKRLTAKVDKVIVSG